MSRFRTLALLLIILWIVEGVNLLTGHRLNALGLLPRSASGLIGIFTAPFLHANLAHLLSNTGGLAILGGLVALRGERQFLATTALIAVIGGSAVWLVGRPALHIGASGLVFGFFGVVVSNAWYQRTAGTIVLAAVAVGLYGGAIWGLLPLQRYVSWEAHLAGFVAGILVARWRRPPAWKT